MFLERFVDEGGSLIGLLVHGGVEDLLFELGVRVQLDKGFLGNILLGMLRRRGFVCLKEVADPAGDRLSASQSHLLAASFHCSACHSSAGPWSSLSLISPATPPS